MLSLAILDFLTCLRKMNMNLQSPLTGETGRPQNHLFAYGIYRMDGYGKDRMVIP